MKGKFALVATLWLAMGGIVVASALPEKPIPKYPQLPSYPPLDATELRLQKLEALVARQQVELQALHAQNQALRADLANVASINDFVSLTTVHGRPTVRFSSVNLQVVNGAGSETTNGLGNVVIGYDQLRNTDSVYAPECSRGIGIGEPFHHPITTQAECIAAGGIWGLNHKGGSHYLVVGSEHNYSGWSGIVSGYGNTSNSPSASVVGGQYNQATGWGSAVSGGAGNRASGYMSSVTGGHDNLASGQDASVSGGYGGTASGPQASIAGGSVNLAAGAAASVGGGGGNTASGNGSSVSGGRDQDVTGTFGWTAGGN